MGVPYFLTYPFVSGDWITLFSIYSFVLGVAWTEEEHRLFLIGLQKLGKGDWRGIARNFVVTRTPTQVASHAQKYFIRQSHATRRKRRSSLFDMVPDMVGFIHLITSNWHSCTHLIMPQ